MSNQTVYVELNALMDTRIACIEEIYGVSTAKRVLANGYETRETDDWGVLDTLINTHEVNSLYTSHDLTLLAKSMMSNLVRVLNCLLYTSDAADE